MANWGTMGNPDNGALGNEETADINRMYRPLPGMLRIGDPAPYEAAGLQVTYDPQYGAMIKEADYNSLPQVQEAAKNSGNIGGFDAGTWLPRIAAGAATLGMGSLAFGGAAGLGAAGVGEAAAGGAAGVGEAAGAVGAAGAAPAASGASAGTLGMFGGGAPMFGGEAALAGSGLGAATGGAGLGAAGLGGLGTAASALGGLGTAASALGGLGTAASALGAGNTTFGIPNNIISGAAQGIGGLLSADAQGDAYKDVANQYLGIGAPYRGQLEASYKPGFDLASQPGYGDAFSRMADISSRSYSAKMGNPADNPTAQAGILKDVWDQGYLPALTNYRGQLGQFGGLGLNTSGSASMGQAGTSGSGWEAIGAGIGTAMSPPKTNWDDVFKGALSIGGQKWGG